MWKTLQATSQPAAEGVDTLEMTPARAAFFMRRFKHEEKLLGPYEQRALSFVIEILDAAKDGKATAQTVGYDETGGTAGWAVPIANDIATSAAVAELIEAIKESRVLLQAFADDGQSYNWLRHKAAEQHLDAAIARLSPPISPEAGQ